MRFYAIRDYSPISVTVIADTTVNKGRLVFGPFSHITLCRSCANKNLYFNFRIDPGHL